jgi:drug/metabolite transporter (DMT)-like permease
MVMHKGLWRSPGWVQSASPRSVGLALTVAGFIIMSPDGLLIRSVGLGSWSLAFWRCVLVAVVLTGFVLLRAGRRAALLQFRAIGRIGLLVAGFSAAANLCFVQSMTHTDVASTLVIVSASPLFAAVLSRAFLGERVAPVTWAAIGIVVVATALIFAGSVGRGDLGGDLVAVGAALAIAASATAIRRGRKVNMMPAIALGNAAAAAVAAPMVDGWIPGPGDLVPLVAMGVLVLPLAVGMVTSGPRYLPAPEVNLLSLIETVLGPLWVWWVLSEAPSVQALAGAAIIVPTLLVHSVLAGRRPPTPMGLAEN